MAFINWAKLTSCDPLLAPGLRHEGVSTTAPSVGHPRVDNANTRVKLAYVARGCDSAQSGTAQLTGPDLENQVS